MRSVFLLFNFMSLLQALQPNASSKPQQRPATLRQQLFTCPAAAGRAGHKVVIFLSQSWGGLHARKPLLAALQNRTSPKLNLSPTTAPP